MAKIKKNKKLIKFFYPVVLTVFSIPMIIACSSEKEKIIDGNTLEPEPKNDLLVATEIKSNSFVLTLTNVQKYQGQTLEVYIKTLTPTEFILKPQKFPISAEQINVIITIKNLNPNTDYAIKIITEEKPNKHSEDVYLIESIKTSKEDPSQGSGNNTNPTPQPDPNPGNGSGSINPNPSPTPKPQPNPNPGNGTNPQPTPEPKPGTGNGSGSINPEPEPTPNPDPGTGSGGGSTINPTPNPEPLPDDGANLVKLLNEVDTLFKVKFSNDLEKETQKNLVKNFFTRLTSQVSSNNETNDPDFIRNLNLKVKNSMIKNSYDMSDDGNFIDVSQLEKNNDDSLNEFNFSNKNSTKPTIDRIYAQQLDFFKRMIVQGTDSAPTTTELWFRRAYWSSLQFGIAFKLNKVDQIKGQYNLGINQQNAFYRDDILKLNKILFISNQIMISIYRHYKLFLDATNDTTKITELANMKILMQAFFYGKNAKKIFTQFLRGNEHYDINNFPSLLKTRNFGRSEPGYLDNVVVAGNAEKTFENLLVYLNYLNFNRDLAIAKVEYGAEKNSISGEGAGAFGGAFRWSYRDSMADYKNRTTFMEVSFGADGKINDIDFNKYFYSNDRNRVKDA